MLPVSQLYTSKKFELKHLGVDSLESFIALLFAAPEAVQSHLKVKSLTKILNTTHAPENVDHSLINGWTSGLVEMNPAKLPQGNIAPFMMQFGTKLPKKIQIEELHAIRDQANRGTCVAHGVTAAFENLNIREGNAEQKKIDFSEQFCYWSTKQDDGYPDSDGSWGRICVPALLKRGICHEEHWAYNPNPTNDPGQGPPPDAALKCAPNHKAEYLDIDPNNIQAIKEQLGKHKRVLTFGVPVFDSSMRNQETAQTGRFVMPINGESPAGGHEMNLIGYVDDKSRPGGGDFILRNSWGTKWASKSPFGAGNGSIPYAYIQEHCMEALCFTKLVK